MKQRILSFLAALCLLHAGAAYAGDAAGAKNFVDGVAKQVLDVLKTGTSVADKQTKLEAIFKDKVDTAFIGKFVLGGHWREATPQQQQDYLAAYGPFVIHNYAAKLTHYSGESYTLTNARQDTDGSFIVTMQIAGGGSGDGPVNVDYRLSGNGGYKLTDIVVEGVSLLTTQRSEFNGIIQNKGIDYLITQLKSKAS